MDLFAPHRADGRSEWRVVYDHVIKLTYGDDVTFEDIAAMLDTEDRSRAHRAVRRCNVQLTREAKPKILGSVRGQGYRVLRPTDYAHAALAYQTSARRKMTTAVDLMRTAPTHDMTPAQQDWAHKVTLVLMDNELRLRTQEQWQQSAEQRLAELENRAGIPPVITVESTEVED